MPVNSCGAVDNSLDEFINDFIKTKEYVRVDKNHLLVDSQEYLKLLLRIGDELETYITMFVRMLDDDFKNKNATITDFYQVAQNKCKCLFKKSVFLTSENWIIYPWDFKVSNKKIVAPNWWKVYNKIKHEKYFLDAATNETYNHKANLKNVLYALSALYLIHICIKNGSCPMSLQRLLANELGESVDICEYSSSSTDNLMSVLTNKNFYTNGKLFCMNTETMLTKDEYSSYVGVK